MLTHLSLFSGIGGLDLAAEWAGFTTIGMVERDPFCQRVLRKHWAGVPIYDDVTTFDATPFRGVHLVTGGFPCQDVSAGNPTGDGLAGARSGLWFEMLRIVRECKPMFVLAENVPALRVRGADRVLYGLEQEGYTVEPFVVGAGNAGAPHQRKRVFIVASNARLQPDAQEDTPSGPIRAERHSRDDDGGGNRRTAPRTHWDVPFAGVRGVAHGLPSRVDRLRALGNAVVPQQCYPILKAIADTLRP